MTKPVLGVVAGGTLGLIDGVSALFYPEARSMMLAIILGSTIKGVLTGLAVGFVAKWRQSLPLGILAGALVGFILSSLVAMGQPAQYWEIVLPGMLVGVITGVICRRWRVAAVATCCLRQTDHSFRRIEVEGRERFPVFGVDRVLTIHGRLSSSTASTGNSMPFYLMDTLGGADNLRGFKESIIGGDETTSTLRSFESFRYRDHTTALFQVDFRQRRF